MEFFRIRGTIPFMKYSLILNGISVLTFLVAVGFLIFRGLNLSVEFTGGTLMEVSYQQPADLEKIRAAVEGKGWGEFQVQNFGTARDVLIRLPVEAGYTSGQQAEKVMATLKSQDPGAELRRVEFVGPAVGAELAHDGAVALALVIIGIMIYLSFRFEWKFAVAAIIANVHDVILVVGMFAIFGWEFSLPVLAAVLAVLLGQRVGHHLRPRARALQEVPQDEHGRGDRLGHHRHHQSHDDHARLHAVHDAGHADLRRSGAALLRAGADHRHSLRHLFVGIRGRRHRHVSGREARRPDQAGQEGRRRAGRALTGAVATHDRATRCPPLPPAPP
jgi:hypothetical protein